MMVRVLLVLGALLTATSAFAQTAPPADGDKPPAAQAKPRAPAPVSSSKSIAERLQACLKTDDETKYRLDCYDAVIAPKPKPKPAAAKGVMDCRFIKEEDERLTCFNGFTEQIPKFTH
jgi:hypothetical protein